jgi:hypothetical protein
MGSVISGITKTVGSLLGMNQDSGSTSTYVASTPAVSASQEAATPTADTSASSNSDALKKKSAGKKSLTISTGTAGGTGTNI